MKNNIDVFNKTLSIVEFNEVINYFKNENDLKAGAIGGGIVDK